MASSPQLLWCNVVVVHQCDVEVSLVTAVVIRTALFEMVTEPSSPVPLLVWIVTRGTVNLVFTAFICFPVNVAASGSNKVEPC